MISYAPGQTFGKACDIEKERIKHALKAELVCGENESGFVYAKAPWPDCKKFILTAYDEVVYQAKMAMDTARALERLATMKYGFSVRKDFADYLATIEEERQKFNDYHYEDDVLWLVK